MSRIIWEGIHKNFSEGPPVGEGFSGPEWVQRSRRKALQMLEACRSGSTIKPVPNLHPHGFLDSQAS